MRNILRAAMSSTCLVLVMSLATFAHGDSGKKLFDKQCAGCHTIGGGDGGGPDLKGVTSLRSHEWLESIIIEPNKLTTNKDPVQAELVKKYGYEMPNLGIGHEDALKIIIYLKEAGDSAAGGTALPASEQMAVVVTPELIAKGKALFIGKNKFSNGGAPCASCHPFKFPGIEGGNLSTADLSITYQKMGDTGMRGALKALKFPTMKKIYDDRPLTDEEITALIVLCKDAAAQKRGVTTAAFPLAGVALFVVLMIGLTLYKRRIA